MPDVEYVVHPEGELDIATVPPLRAEWLRAVEQQQPALFVVDLGAVTYLDSTALGAIVAVHKQQQRHGGELIVTNANPRLAKLFQMTGLGVFLDVNGPNRYAGQDGYGANHRHHADLADHDD